MKASKAVIMLVVCKTLCFTATQAVGQEHEAGWFNSAYAHIGADLSPQGWGSLDPEGTSRDYDLTSRFAGGLHVSVYGVINQHVHLGLYFNYFTGKSRLETLSSGDVGHFGLGASIKVGGKVSNHVWLGFVGDIGYYALAVDSLDDTYSGFEIAPRIHVDVLPTGVGIAGLKMGFFSAFGPTFVPYLAGSTAGVDFQAWLITLQLRFGLTFGA